MKWLFKKLLLNVVNDFEAKYTEVQGITHSETMRPDIYHLQKYLKGELK